MIQKIAIIGPAYPYRGGIATFNERLALELQNAGHHVDLITFTLQYPEFIFPGKTQLSSDPPPQNIRIRKLINTLNPLHWIKAGFEIKNAKYDVIIFRYWMPFFALSFGTMARIIRGNKQSALYALTDNVKPHEKRLGDNLLTSFFFSQMDGFIYMSNTVLQDLNKFEPTKPKWFHLHPVFDVFGSQKTKEEARTNLKLSSKGKYILFFGLIREYKGLDILLEAMADERLKSIELNLIIAGEFYSNQEKYLKLIVDLALTERVILKPFYISDKDVADYFCAVDAVVQPYKTATQSGVTQIAYQFNKPMIVTNVGGLPELVPDNEVGFVTEVSKDAIADAIFKFYNLGLEEKFSNNIAEIKKKFSWSTLAQLILRLKKNN
ncbi:glycosyl transferase [Adhaeribacter aerolatus]|uniref:Glycosyl transferase n=1 Tax=Adhaeribacter aerolatus TaxID=670289 RepID=A0A512B5Z6_9BACT|nr:glycosyltransferase family 4 protein [Adhaeribacter aerolatus]GEO07385.1 glycosyl transferase [Adhaeribacter aerolatus]